MYMSARSHTSGTSSRVDDETEVEPVEITGEGDVEAVSVGDDRHRELVTQLRPASYSG